MKISKLNFLLITLTICLLTILPVSATYGILYGSEPVNGATVYAGDHITVNWAGSLVELYKCYTGACASGQFSLLEQVFNPSPTTFTVPSISPPYYWIRVQVATDNASAKADFPFEEGYNPDTINGDFNVTPDIAHPYDVIKCFDLSTSGAELTDWLWTITPPAPHGEEYFWSQNIAFMPSWEGYYTISLQVINANNATTTVVKTNVLQIINTSNTTNYNIEYHIKNPDGSPNAGALIKHFVNETSYYSGNADSSGVLDFGSLPSEGVARCEVYPIEETYTTFGDSFIFDQNLLRIIYLSTKGAPGGEPTPTPTITPTPTVTPIPSDNWSMDIYPSSINLGESSQLYISNTNSSKMLDAKTVLYYENNNLGAYSQYILIGVYHWNTSTSNWDFRTDNDAVWDFTPHDPILLMVTPATSGTYTYQAAIFGSNSLALGTATGTLLIGSQGGEDSTLQMLLFAVDAETVSHLQNYELTLSDGNISHTYNVSYDVTVTLQRGGIYSLTGVKTGYETGTKTFTVPISQAIQAGDNGAMVEVLMYLTNHLPTAGNCTVVVHAADQETYYPLPNVQVSISGVLAPKFTGTSGESVSFTIAQNTQFTVTGIKNGYCSATETKNTSTNTYMYVDLYLKLGNCGGVTPTQTVTPTITPTITPILQQVNQTIGVCNASMVNTTWIQKARNYVACLGITDLLSQNTLLGLIIILGIGFFAAWKAKTIGFVIGSVIGTIIAYVFSFVSFWWIIVLVLCSIAIVSIKIFTSNSGG